MSNAMFNTFCANSNQSSPTNNSGEHSSDVSYLPSSYSESFESSYNADSEYIPASYEQFPELGPDVYSGSYFVYDGSQVVPTYYPIPTYYDIYNGVSAIENNGTTYYNYYQFAVPIYCFSSDLTTVNIITSGGDNVSHTEEFANEIVDNVNEDSYSDQLTPSSNNVNDVACNDPPEELIDEFTEFYDEARDSSIMIPGNDFMAEERQNDIKRKKDWLYLLSLSGKLHMKDHIPEVHVMPEILEEDEDVEISEEDEDVKISEEILESGNSLEKELWNDVFPERDKSDGDQKNLKSDAIESTYGNGAHKEKCQASGEENDVWKDFFYSIDDPVFGIEACFSNTSEKKLINESFHSDLDKKNVKLLSTYRKTFMILPRLNKQIQILPTIVEEDESVINSEILDVIVEKTPDEINKENTIGMEKGCLKSKQQNAEEMESNCGVSEATEEVGTSEKPKKKKRFKGIRRFFSELRSCFKKSESPPG